MPLNFKFGADSSELQSELQNSAKSIEDNTAKMRTSFSGLASDTQRYTRVSADYVGQYARDVQKHAQLMTREIEIFTGAFSKNFDAVGAKARDQSGVFDSFAQEVAAGAVSMGAAIGEMAIKAKSWYETLGKGIEEVKHPIDTIDQGISKLTNQTMLSARDTAVQLGNSFMEMAISLGALSSSLGISISQMQDITGAARASGVGVEVFVAAIKNIKSALSESNEDTTKTRKALESLGISLSDTSGKTKTWHDVFVELADKFPKYEEGLKKSTLATTLFTAEGAKIAGVLNLGSSAFEQYLQIAQNANTKITESEVRRAEALKRSLQIETEETHQQSKRMGEAWFDLGTKLNAMLYENKSTWDKWREGVTGVFDALVKAAALKASEIQKSLSNMIPSQLKSGLSERTKGSGAALAASQIDLDYPLWWLTPEGQPLPGGYKRSGEKEVQETPANFSIDDFRTGLKREKNKPGNIYDWDADATRDYWVKAYQWAEKYYGWVKGQDTELKKQIWDEFADSARAAQETDKDKNGKSRVSEWTQESDEKSLFKMADSYNSGALAKTRQEEHEQKLKDLQEERKFWEEKLAIASVDSGEYDQVYHKVFESTKKILEEESAYKKRSELEQREVSTIMMEMKRQEANTEIAIEQDKIKNLYELGKIDAATRLRLENELYQKEYQAAINAKWAELDVKNQSIIQQARIYKEIEKLQLEHQRKTANAEAQMVAASKRNADRISSFFSGSINSMLFSTQTWSQKFQSLAQSAAERVIDTGIKKIVEAWVIGEATKTGATAAGEASRTAIETAAQAEGFAGKIAKLALEIDADAAAAAAGAYKALAGIPIIGPVLGAAAAAVVFTAVSAYGAMLPSAAGGWEVPQDTLAYVHKNEMILPADISGGLRGMVAAGAGARAAGGGDVHHHWTVNTLDAKSFAQMLDDNGSALWKTMNKQVGKFKHLGGR